MCSPAVCRTCGKATYRGCGLHVDLILAGVPKAQRCDCGTGGTPARYTPAWLNMFRRR